MDSMITSRAQVTQIIIARKVQNNLRWSQLAELLGQSKEWTTAACMGQMPFDKRQAEIVGDYFKLTDEHVAWLQITPHKSSPGIPHDPCLYRLYEVSLLRLYFSVCFSCSSSIGSWRLRSRPEGINPWGIRRWHYECHRFYRETWTWTKSRRWSRSHGVVWKIFALQAILICGRGTKWMRKDHTIEAKMLIDCALNVMQVLFYLNWILH